MEPLSSPTNLQPEYRPFALVNQVNDLLLTVSESYRIFCGKSLDQVIPASTAEIARSLAENIERHLSQNSGFIQLDTITEILEKSGFPLNDPGGSQGLFVRLHKLDPLAPGRKPGCLMFAVIPEGHTATSHIHLNGGIDGLPGEFTVNLVGELRYLDGSEVKTHRIEDGVRISQADLPDRYLPQEKIWIGFYLQPENCKLLMH